MTTTEVARGFSWVETPGGTVLVADAIRAVARHGFTTRRFGAAVDGPTGPLDALASWLGVERAAVVRVRQVHGCGVIDVRSGQPLGPAPEGDALVSTDPARAVAVAVADCVPVLIADRGGRAVAAVHAGWRGTAARIVTAAVAALARAGVPSSDLVAAIGPSIGPCCYQIDTPVRDAILAGSPEGEAWFVADGDGHWRLDLAQANADQLAGTGLAQSDIHVARLCTADHPEEWFSYRKEGAAAGRLFGAIRLLPEP